MKTKNIKDFKPVDLGGEPIQIADLNKLFGNTLYFSAKDVSVIESAKAIYNELDFVVTPELTAAIPELSKSIVFWLVDQFSEFIKA